MAIVTVSFTGITDAYSVRATSYLGIHPGVADLLCLPQLVPPASPNGILSISDGLQTVNWLGAHLDKTSIRYDRRGQMIGCTIQDRRVWWRYTTIHGLYNERDPDGQVIPQSEKTPQELATLLLTAMGETVYDVSALPNELTDRPLANWSCANAAAELHKLCRERGCDIALSYYDNSVYIVALGTGDILNPIYDEVLQSISYDIDLGEVPQTLRIATGDVLVQQKFELEAVGLDEDGQYKAFDDLSYAPDDWTLQTPGALLPTEDPKIRALANSSMYLVYRIKNFSDGTLTVRGMNFDLTDIRQCLPLFSTLAEVYDDPIQGKIHKEAYVEGSYVTIQGSGVQSKANTNNFVRTDVGFRIFYTTGYVVFKAPVFKITVDNTYEPAELYLTASFNVRDNSVRQYIRYVYDFNLGGIGIATISRPDLVRRIVANYHPTDPTEFQDVTDNQTVVDEACLAVANAAMTQFTTQTSGVAKFIGIIGFQLDGINRQLTWVAHRFTGANTFVGRNSEPEYGVARANERVRLANQLSRDYENADLNVSRNDLRARGRLRQHP